MSDDTETSKMAGKILNWAMRDLEIMAEVFKSTSRENLEAYALEMHSLLNLGPPGGSWEVKADQLQSLQAMVNQELEKAREREANQTDSESRGARTDEGDHPGCEKAVEEDDARRTKEST